MDDGTRDKITGKLKETEGKLTGDEIREKQGQGEGLLGDIKDKFEDVKDRVEDVFDGDDDDRGADSRTTEQESQTR